MLSTAKTPRFRSPEEANRAASLRILNAARRQQRRLSLSGWGLSRLPADIGKATSLTHLDLSANRLTNLPPEVGQLTKLEWLNLGANQLTALPHEIGRLTVLKALLLNDNRLAVLPSEIGRLWKLQLLSLSDNKLANLPRELGNLTGLDLLMIGGNPLPDPYPRLIEQGPSKVVRDVLGYLRGEIRDLSKEGSRLATVSTTARLAIRLDEALAASNSSIERFPYDVIARLNRAETLSDMGRLDESLAAYEETVRMFPADVVARIGFADKLSTAGRYDAGLAAYDEIIRDFPQNVIAWNRRAQVLRDMGRFEEALSACEDTIAMFPDDVVAANLRAEMLRHLGRHLPLFDGMAEDAAAEIGRAETLGASLSQRPAAFRFGLRRGRIDALPELSDAIDDQFARDTYDELLSKVRALAQRLIQGNCDPRVRGSVERLLAALGTRLKDVRPGVLLSRSRSIEADRSAFDTEEARRELFPDAIAMMDDTLQSLHDLLAVFPFVRRIEAERLALNLQQNAVAISAIREQTDTIKVAAANSEAVTRGALGALADNDEAIAEAPDLVVKTALVADQLLVTRNFTSEVVGAVTRSESTAWVGVEVEAGLVKAGAELADLGSRSWEAVKTGLPKGIEATAMAAPLMGLLYLIAGPIGMLAAIVPVFKPIATAIAKLPQRGSPPRDGNLPSQVAKPPKRRRPHQRS